MRERRPFSTSVCWVSARPISQGEPAYYEAALAQGRAKQDTAALFAVLKEMASKGETAS